MFKKYIKLLGPVFHDGIEYQSDTVLTISETITESEAERLVKLGAAQYYTPIVIPETRFIPKNTDNLNNIPPVTGMTKSQCQTELTAAGIEFKKTANLAELQKLVNVYRESLQKTGANGGDDDDGDGENLDINGLTRDQLESELTARAIEFSSEQSDDELRQLLIDDNDKFDINGLNREQLESELTARAIEFRSEQSDDELRQLLIDDEKNGDE